MPRYVFDIETNGFLEQTTKIHSLVMKDADTGEIISAYGDTIEPAVRRLMAADQIIGHNVIKFDIPAIQKIYPWFQIDRSKVIDTLVMTRLIWADVKEGDFTRKRKGTFPARLIGKHSLEAWGHRLGNYKGDFKGPWDTWTEEMQLYCVQDVELTADLFSRIEAKNYSETATWVEHQVAWLMAQQERNGFPFDEKRGAELYAKLSGEREKLSKELRSLFPEWYVGGKVITPQKTINYKDPKRPSITEGAPYTQVKLTEFNPTSRQHIADRLMKLRGWVPEEFTDKGQPKVDDAILAKLPYPEAKPLSTLFMIQKRIGQLAEGDEEKAWLAVVKDGKIHGAVNPNGAVTGRATHSFPNLAQVPSVTAPYGEECRSLFCVLPGFKLVGSDLSGIELRALAHFMAKYDDGAYGRVLLEADIHWANVQAMGLVAEGVERDDTNPYHKVYRNGAKTFIYGFLYGAGDAKVGRIVYDIIVTLKSKGLDYQPLLKKFFKGQEELTEADFVSAGRKLKKQFLAGLPALKNLKEAVAGSAEKGWIKGLDGRKLRIRSSHAALNTLLQSAGALIAKVWIIFLEQELQARGYHHGWDGDYAFVAWVHDEVQIAVREPLAEEVGKLAVEMTHRAGEFFNIRIKIDGEYKVGNNWADTH